MVWEWATTVAVGMLAFVATHLDDLFLVTAFLAKGSITRGEAVLGQVAGTAVLMGLACAGALGTVLLPPEWHHFLGLIPLAIGVKHLRDAWRRRGRERREAPEARVAREAAAAGAAVRSAKSGALGRKGTITVALLAIAHGGDNVGVYVVLFGTETLWNGIAYLVIALGVAVAWGWLGAALIAHPTLGKPLRRAAPWLLPWVLMALGVAILWPNV